MTILPVLLTAALAFGATIHFRKTNEPKEGAFTLLVPSGWRLTGGIIRINPMAAGGPLNSIAAKLDMQIASPDGATVLRWFPEMNYADLRGQPAAPMFRPGSNYNGAVVWPKMHAAGYLQQVVFPQSHRGAGNVRVKGVYPLPKIAASYRQVVERMRVPIAFSFDAALLVVTYSEGGAQWEEALYTAIQDWGPAVAGLWTNKDTFAVRTRAGSLEKLGPVVSVMLESVRLNPKWVEVGSNAWNHRWVNEHGEAVYSDDPNFDPKRMGLEGFVRSPVRKRFPDR